MDLCYFSLIFLFLFYLFIFFSLPVDVSIKCTWRGKRFRKMIMMIDDEGYGQQCIRLVVNVQLPFHVS